jgi:hypothetical protein
MREILPPREEPLTAEEQKIRDDHYRSVIKAGGSPTVAQQITEVYMKAYLEGLKKGKK